MSTIERLPLAVDHLPEEKRAKYEADSDPVGRATWSTRSGGSSASTASTST